MLVFLCTKQQKTVRCWCIPNFDWRVPNNISHLITPAYPDKNPLTNNLQNKFGDIKIIVVYLYPKLNTMKIDTTKIRSVCLKIDSYGERMGEPFKRKNKIYVFPWGETLLENLENRRSRPYTMYKKEIIPKVMEYIKKRYPKQYKEVKDAKWSWSQKCGCSMCPCSPGFVSDIDGNLSIQVEIGLLTKS